MLKPTMNPSVMIEEQREGYVRYVREKANGRFPANMRWEVLGTCNRCGLCQIGGDDPNIVWEGPLGTPNAERDITYGERLDNPILPGFTEQMEKFAATVPTATVKGCSMSIKVL